MYPDHTASSIPGLCNFLLYFFNYLAISNMVSQYLVLIALLWRVDHSKGENYHRCILPATYNYLGEAILLRCTKYSLETELQKLSSPVPHGHSEQFSLKSIKGNLHTNKNYNSVSVYN